MKKIILLLTAVAMMLTFSACASENVDENNYSTMEYLTSAYFQDFVSMRGTSMDSFVEMPTAQIVSTYGLTEESALIYKTGFKSWSLIDSDLGDYVDIDSFKLVYSNEGMAGTVTASFAKRQLDFTLTVDEFSGEPISFQVEPYYTTGEKMATAGLNTVMGMGTVFVLLILIAFLISLFKYINKAEQHFAKKKAEKEKANQPFVPVDPAAAPVVLEAVEPEELTDDLELVAVITAAIAASSGQSVDQLVVRSIKRRNTSKWQKSADI